MKPDEHDAANKYDKVIRALDLPVFWGLVLDAVKEAGELEAWQDPRDNAQLLEVLARHVARGPGIVHTRLEKIPHTAPRI